MSTKSPISLVNFFVFNSKYGPKEGEEHKRILYYYPADVDLDTKIRNVGLCEAIIKFTETFTDKPCQSLHTQKTREIYIQPEPDFWIVMTVSVPYSQKSKDGQTYGEYHEENVQDSVYEAVLQQSYKMHKLFNGTFHHTVKNLGVEILKGRLEYFFSKHLLTLRLNQNDLLDIFNGIHFLPLDKNTYLRIQCFINLLEATFPKIRYSAFLYNDQLVWSGLEQDDMRVLYHYMLTSMFPSYMEHEFQGSHSGAASASSTHYGKYITGPPSMKDEHNLGKVPRIYVNTDTLHEDCHLVVYKALSASIVMLIDGKFQLNFDYFRKLDNFLGRRMSELASDIGEQYSRRPSTSSDVSFKYVYFNHMNLAQKTTIHADGKKSSSVTVSADVLQLLSDLNDDLKRVTPVEDGETIVKMCTDCWVVGKKSDQREFYVILNQKNANLIEINEEVKKLCASQFSNIFFLD